MIAPWQQFSGSEVSLCASVVDQHFTPSTAGKSDETLNNPEFETGFLSLFDGINDFSPNDSKLLHSARNLDRIFTLPNHHSRGLYFFGAQGKRISANGADDSAIGAIRSCLGEALERWIHSDPTLAQEKSINPAKIPLAKPSGNCLQWFADQQGCDESRYKDHMEWVAATSLVSNEILLVPTDFAFRTGQSNDAVYQSETNGMSTGPDKTTAITAALLELIERDTLALWWYSGSPAYQLNLEPTTSFKLISYANSARRNSSRPFWLVNIENEFQIPAIAALSADGNGQQIIAGFSANTDVFKACCSAICELGQMELGLQLVQMKLKEQGPQSLNENDHRQLVRAKQLSLTSYPELYPPLADDTIIPQQSISGELQMNFLLDRINDAGYIPYVIDLTDTNIGVPCYRAVVPGLESCSINRASKRLRHRITQSGTTIEHLCKKPALI